MTMPRTHRYRLTPAVVALLALPVVMGPGRCGFIIDYTETFLFADEIERVVLGADDGSIVATMYEREGTLLKRHTFGFEPSVGSVTEVVEDGALTLEARCKYEDNCRYDHMFELPLGIALEITMADAQISLGYLDSDVEVTFETGWFEGVRLAAPNFTLTLAAGDVTVDFAAPPETVTISVQTGSVVLAVPTGAYRCVLAATVGKASTTGITCDDAAAAVLDVQIQTGDIVVRGV